MTQRGLKFLFPALLALACLTCNRSGYAPFLTAPQKILIGGPLTSYDGVPVNNLARLNMADGALDTGFSFPNTSYVTSAVDSLQRVYAVVGAVSIHRLGHNGAYDSNFATGQATGGQINSIVFDSSDRLYAGGNFLTFGGVSVTTLIRLTGSGALDPSFSQGLTTISLVSSMVIDTGGKIYVGDNNGNVQRLYSNGALDSSFNPSNFGVVGVAPLLIDSNGSFFAGTNSNSYKLSTVDGSILLTFTGRLLCLDSANRIYINSGSAPYITRYLPNGSVDSSFSPPNGGFNNVTFDCAVDSLGRIVVVGPFTAFGSTSLGYIARLNSNGTLDTTFNPGGSGFNFNNLYYPILLVQ